MPFAAPRLSGWKGLMRFLTEGIILILLTAPHAFAGPLLALPGGDHPAEEKQGKETASILDTLFIGPEIVVEGVRTTPDMEIFSRSGFVGLIRLDKEKNVMSDAAAILSRSTGVSIRQYGGLGGFATMSIRGSSSTQVQFYLDGVPLNDAWSGMTNLADIALGDISRIEIYRGFSPAGFGASSIGGTVNLVPDYGAEPSVDGRFAGIGVAASTGSFGSKGCSLSARAGAGAFRFNCHGGYNRSGGDFTFLDDNSTPENAVDDETVTRENNDFSRWNLTGRLGIDMPGFKTLSLHHDGFSREGGVPGIGANQSTRARLERSRRITYLKAKGASLLSGAVHADATLFHSWTAERFEDPGGDINLARQATDNRILSDGGSIRSKLYPPRLPLSVELFLENRREIFRPVSYLPSYSSGPDRKRNSTTLAVSSDLFLSSERIVLTANHRSEWYASEFYDPPVLPWMPPTPQGRKTGDMHTPGAGFRVQPAAFITIKGNWGLYYRVPTFFEMFGNLGSVTGDSSLRPESGQNRDIGVVVAIPDAGALSSVFIEAIYLYNEVEDLILFFPNSQSTIKPQNIGSAAIGGIELSWSAALYGSLTVSGNYCRLDSRDRGPVPYYNGNALPGRPKQQASLSFDYQAPGWRAGYELCYIGSNFLDRANHREAGGRCMHNVSLVLKPSGEGISFAVEGYNLGGEQACDVSGFPLPGRSFLVSMRFEL